MTELEKATVEAFKQLGSISYFEMFKAGAEWQKKQLIEKAYEWPIVCFYISYVKFL